MSTLLVTGTAGFIGSSVAGRLLADGHAVIGVDDFNPYFFPSLKRARHRRLAAQAGFTGVELDLADRDGVERLFRDHGPDQVIHLAAQAGVRFSVQNPHLFQRANVEGFLNVMDAARRAGVARMVYASSSSVYGGAVRVPYREEDRVDRPISLYAATKLADELMAHAYGHLHGMSLIGLRFFTVYGPWGRPDMAMWIFAERILRGLPLPVYNFGRMRRDFTYVDDVVRGTLAVLAAPAEAGHRVFNLGAGRCVDLEDAIRLLEGALGRTAVRDPQPLQAGDVLETWADVSRLKEFTGFEPSTPIEAGIPAFARWYLDHPELAEQVARERGAIGGG